MDLEREIEKYLEHPQLYFNGKDMAHETIKSFFTYIQSKITSYEKLLYDREAVDDMSLKKIKVWRSRLIFLVKQLNERKSEQKNLVDDHLNNQEQSLEEKKGIETLRMLNKQIETADTNKTILDKSTLKLLSLDYSADELKKAMEDARKKIDLGLSKEKQEVRSLFISLLILICVSLLILSDKFFISKKGKSFSKRLENNVVNTDLL